MRDREGATLLDRDGTLRVQIVPPAFRSAGWLASAIAHEVEVHVARQIAKAFYRTLHCENRKRIDEGVYMKW